MAKKNEEVKPKKSFREKAKEMDERFAQEEQDRIFIPSGSIYYDWGLGGGYQTGRVYEKMAWEGAGKTTTALHAVAETQKMGKKVVYIDAEHALDKGYAKKIGVNWNDEDTFTLFQPDCGEDGFEYAREMMETGEVTLVVIDSINGMLPKKMMEDPAGTASMGLHARLLGQEIPKLKARASKYNVAVICISQLREKIGVMFGNPETTQGGHALKFWASGRIEMRKSLDKEGDEVVGIITKFKVVKNKVATPYRKGEIPITFGVGIDKLQEVINLGKEFELLKVRAGIITYNEVKYPEAEFRSLLYDNPEFYEQMKGQIITLLNNHGEVEPPENED